MQLKNGAAMKDSVTTKLFVSLDDERFQFKAEGDKAFVGKCLDVWIGKLTEILPRKMIDGDLYG